MIPILVVTHGEFGPQLVKSAEGMLGPVPALKALGLSLDESRESFTARVDAALGELGPGVLVLADIAGGTPWNTAIALTLTRGGDLLGGVSLPLLIEAVQRRAKLSDAARLATELAQESYVVRAKALLGGAGGT